MKPVMIELFSGSARMASEFEKRGFEVVTIDLEHDSTYKVDIRDIHARMLPQQPAVVWASPPCTAFSVASIGRHWGNDEPSDNAVLGVRLLAETLRIIMELRSGYWFIENPVGMMRTLPILKSLPRKTITFCAYGEPRRKPTDIWTNCDAWVPRPSCSNGDPCHEAAPRGSRTGTQGVKGAYDRAALPIELCAEIAQVCSELLGVNQKTLIEVLSR